MCYRAVHNVFESAESGAAVAEEEIAPLHSPAGDSVTPVAGAYPIGGDAGGRTTSFDA